MKTSIKLFSAVVVLSLVSACSNNTASDSKAFATPDSKPQVVDYLKGKASSQVLNIKYKALKAACALEAFKSVNAQANQESAGVTPPANQPPITNNPPTLVSVEKPTPYSFTYNLKAQAQIDQDLKEQIRTSLNINIDNQKLKVDVVVKPISFQEYLSLDLNKKKYLMKYTPVLSYTYNFELIREDSTMQALGDGKIYEKIDNSKKILTTTLGNESYDFVLNCVLNREINSDNPDMAAEFESQWVEINCQAPKSEEEVSICVGQ
jgi:hypothetical protein